MYLSPIVDFTFISMTHTSIMHNVAFPVSEPLQNPPLTDLAISRESISYPVLSTDKLIPWEAGWWMGIAMPIIPPPTLRETTRILMQPDAESLLWGYST